MEHSQSQSVTPQDAPRRGHHAVLQGDAVHGHGGGIDPPGLQRHPHGALALDAELTAQHILEDRMRTNGTRFDVIWMLSAGPRNIAIVCAGACGGG